MNTNGLYDNTLIVPKLYESSVTRKSELYSRRWGLVDKIFEYVVLRGSILAQVINPPPPQVFTIDSGGCLAISDTYPDFWSELGILHELYEHGQINGILHTCVQATEWEIELASNRFDEEKLQKYKIFRIEFFKGVLCFYETKKGSRQLPLEEVTIVEGLKESLAYLESIQAP